MPSKVKWLVVAMGLYMTGSSFMWPLNSIFVTHELGKSIQIAGYVIMLFQFSNFISQFIGGKLFDQYGASRPVALGLGINLAALTGLMFNNTWPYFPVFLCMLGFGAGLIFPAIYALSAKIWPEGGRKTFNFIYVANNLGIALGSMIGGYVASYSYKAAYLCNFSLFALFFIIYLWQIKKRADQVSSEKPEIEKEILRPSRNVLIPFILLNIGYIFCWLTYTQWHATISSYTLDLGISLAAYTSLWTFNGILIVAGQPLLTYFTNRWLSTYKRQLIIGFLIFLVGCGYLFVCHNLFEFMIAMTFFTIAEMLVWPAVPAIADSIAPEGQTGKYQGIVGAVSAFGRMSGPLIGGTVVVYGGMNALYGMMTLLILIGTTLVAASFRFQETHSEVGSYEVETTA